MDVIVLKIGGSILREPKDYKKIREFVKKQIANGKSPICVVSAMKGVTDQIIEATRLVKTDQTFNPKQFVETLFKEHLMAYPSESSRIEFEKEFERLEHVLNYIHSSGELGDSVYAYAVSRGENFAMRTLAAYLDEEDINSICYYGEDIIVTDDNCREAAVNLNKTKLKVKEILSPKITSKFVPIIAGFAGRSESGLVSILGRGGTDDTAACIAYSLEAKELVKFVDEGGIMTVDPKFADYLMKSSDIIKKVGMLKHPKLIPYMSYLEASELLREERTKVVHFKVLNPLMKGGIKLFLRSIDDKGNGTVIGPENGITENGAPKALSFQRDLYCVRVLPIQSVMPIEIYADVFGILAKNGVDIRYLTLSGYQISLLMSRQDVDVAVKELSLIDSIMEAKAVDGKKATISIIGSEMRGVKGFFSRLTGALANSSVNIEQATQPNSENIIRLCVADDDLPVAVATLYKEFF